MAIVADSREGRIYLSPNADHEKIAATAEATWEPEGELFEKALGFRVPAYGMTNWKDLFTNRQLVALTTFSDLVMKARERILFDAEKSGILDGDPSFLRDGGSGAAAFRLLAFASVRAPVGGH